MASIAEENGDAVAGGGVIGGDLHLRERLRRFADYSRGNYADLRIL